MNTNINITEEELEKIEQFLEGKLPSGEASAFQKRIQEDSQWAEKLNITRLTILGIREAALSDTLKNIPLNKENAPVIPIKRKKLGMVLSLTAAAAALVIVVISLTMSGVFSGKNSRLFSEYFQPDTGLITSMGVTESYDFEVAMIDYKSGKYTDAIEKWTLLRKGHENNDTLNYFIGSSYLALKDPKPAIPYFQEVITKKDGVFFHDANWYLGLALIKTGKTAEAIPYIAASNHISKEKLLKKLRK